MARGNSRFDWIFLMWWVVATTFGSTISFFLIANIIFQIGLPIFGDDIANPSLGLQLALALLFALGGFTVGLLQWLVLRGIMHKAGWWVLATSMGWMIGNLISILASTRLMSGASTTLISLAPWLTIGAAVGLLQWLVLRREFSYTGWWIPISAVTFVIGAAGWVIGSICGGAASWLAAGAITGLSLYWLMR